MTRGSGPDEEPDASRTGPTRRSVKATYDLIARHFAETRPEPWPEVASFVRGRTGTRGLDLGVGNGRHAELLAECCRSVVGVDASGAALWTAAARARDRGFDVCLLVGDAVTLPVRDDCVDVAVYIATIHHLPTQRSRRTSLDELARVLGPGGSAIVSAWCVSHDRFDAERGFDTTVGWTLPDGEVVDRYYHVYDLEEFERDVDASALARVDSYESAGNCYAVVEPEQ